jgi:hypothetical protein
MRIVITLLAICAVTGTACTDNGTGPGTEFQITAPATEVIEGRELTLSASAGGQPVDARDIQWSSSDPSTVRVTNGVVRGMAPGVAFVRAGTGVSRDSVEITVRFARSATAGMAVRIAGETNEVIRMEGAGMILQPIGLASRHLQLRAGSDPLEESVPGGGIGDSLLFINFPGPIAVGTATLNPTVVDWPSWSFPENSGAFFEIRDSGSRLRFYFPVTPPRLEITDIRFPAEPGNVTGLITGSIWFEAAGIVTDFDETTRQQYVKPLSDTTVAIYAEFVTPIFHVLTPRISMSVEGGPDAGVIAGGGAAVLNGGGLSLRLHGYPAGTGEDITKIFQGSLWIPAPAIGTTSVASVDARVLTDSIGAPVAWARLSSMPLSNGSPGTQLHAFSESGTVTISDYQPPTRTGFGRVEGEIAITLRYPPDAPVQGTTVLKARFLFPVNPLDGHPLDIIR